jgi:hypothetical protein
MACPYPIPSDGIGRGTSSDGIAWTKDPAQVLSPHPGGWESLTVKSPVALSEPGIIRLWYMGEDSQGSPRVGSAWSTDGLARPPTRGIPSSRQAQDNGTHTLTCWARCYGRATVPCACGIRPDRSQTSRRAVTQSVWPATVRSPAGRAVRVMAVWRDAAVRWWSPRAPGEVEDFATGRW